MRVYISVDDFLRYIYAFERQICHLYNLNVFKTGSWLKCLNVRVNCLLNTFYKHQNYTQLWLLPQSHHPYTISSFFFSKISSQSRWNLVCCSNTSKSHLPAERRSFLNANEASPSEIHYKITQLGSKSLSKLVSPGLVLHGGKWLHEILSRLPEC